ncbi:hypothetical protein ES703_87425 [subsurface metagenome]
MISLLVCSRISGNKNFALFNFLDSLKRMSSNYENFEVLVKFDSDDRKVKRLLPKLDTYPFKVKHVIEPRGRGYADLHIFYNSLFSQVDKRSVVIGAMADDFEIIQQGWDEIILSKTNVFPDQIFIIHGRPHPPHLRKDYQERKFYLDFDINSLDKFYIDEAPLWSRKLLETCGGLGHSPFTDAWTVMLEYYLFHRCGINRTIFLEQPIEIRRIRKEVDSIVSLRYWTDRANNFAFMKGRFYNTLVEQQAVNIYCNIKAAEKSALPPPLVQKELDYKPADLPPIPFEIRVLGIFPVFMHPGLLRLYWSLYPRLSSISFLRRLKRSLERRLFHT